MKKTIIIGGGVSGLAAAFRLFESGNEFVLLEAGDRLGGIIQTIRREGFLLETGPDAFLSEKPEAVRLARRLGIESELLGTRDENRRAFLVYENSLRPVPEGFQLIAPSNLDAFFNSDILSPRGKVRLANERFLLPEAEKEDESLADFVRRRFGQEALERIAQPMIGGIYTADPEKLSLRATQPRFLELEQKYGSVINGLLKLQSENRNRKPETEGSGARYSLFLSFQNGMETLTNALSAKLPPNSLKLSTKAESLSFSETNRLWKVETNTGIFEAETVILALPAHISARLLSSQFPALAEKLNSIEHASSATVNLAFRRDHIEHPLDGFGFLVPFFE
ncbi:MAG TPA: protoporphyrinogen oxidase [Pyrinomonadaceae bacterium]|nr:protoporphyrinogen oxidase [Pyrinomonadaceae bacterium]